MLVVIVVIVIAVIVSAIGSSRMVYRKRCETMWDETCGL